MNGSPQQLPNLFLCVNRKSQCVKQQTKSSGCSFYFCQFFEDEQLFHIIHSWTKELPTLADWYAVSVYLQFRLKHELVQTQTEVFLFPGINPLLPWNWCFLCLPKQQWRLVWINNRNAKEIMETVVELDYFYYNNMLVKCNTGAAHHKQCHSNRGNSW